MKDLSNINPQQPRKSYMQEPVTEERKQKGGQRIALKICKLYYQAEKNNNNYKRSILIEEDQKPNKKIKR